MSVEQPRSRMLSSRVTNAREALLSGSAHALLEPIREVLCEPTRTQIVRALGPGPLSVSELAVTLCRSKSATSQHLRVLRERGVVNARRRGRAVIYALAPEPLVDLTVQLLERAATISPAPSSER
jgi:DNA-binding transcriptional ArsR family regulator